MDLITTAVVILIGFLALKLWRWKVDVRDVINKIPGPDSSWDSTDPRKNYIQLRERYGPIYRLWYLKIRPMVVITEPEDVKFVLNSEDFQITQRVILKPTLGDGLVRAVGDTWRIHRKLVNPAFAINVLKKMGPTMLSSGLNLVAKWDALIENNPDPKNPPVIKLQEDLTDAAADVIGLTAFATDFGRVKRTGSGGVFADIIGLAIGGGKAKSEPKTKSGSKPDGKSILKSKAKKGNAFSASLLGTFPFLLNAPIPALRKLYKRMELVKREMSKVIAKRESERGKEENERDLLGALINAKEDGATLSEKEIMDETMTFLFAGTDTTSNLLSWFFYEVSLRPDVEKKIHEELDAVLQGELPTVDIVPKLKYLNMVIQETLRVRPPVPSASRVALKDSEIRGYKIPKGTMIAMGALAVHMNPSVWDNPQKFDPDRWLNDSEHVACGFIPFSSGPRACIGRNFALQEAKLFASLFMQKFRFEYAGKEPVEPVFAVVMRPNKLHMRLYRR